MTIEKVQELSEKWLRKRIDDRTLEKLLFKIVEIAKNTNSIEELNIVLDMHNVDHCLNNFIYAFILGVENKVFSWKLIEDVYNKWGVDNIELYEDDSGEFLRRGDWETIRLPRVFESYTPWFFSRSQYTEHLKTFIFHPEATTIQTRIVCECDTLETIIMPKHLVPVKALDRRDHYHFFCNAYFFYECNSVKKIVVPDNCTVKWNGDGHNDLYIDGVFNYTVDFSACGNVDNITYYNHQNEVIEPTWFQTKY